jgi:hypothetical protein
MDDHKLVMISIFGFFLMKNMLGKFLGFGRMQQNIFFFLKIF